MKARSCVIGLASGVLLVGALGLTRAQPRAEAEILERLERIERGLFADGSKLVRQRDQSIERKLVELERLAGQRRVAAPVNAGALRPLELQLDDIDDRLEREVERRLEQVERDVAEIGRHIERAGSSRLSDLPRAVEGIRRTLDSIERRLGSIERRIR